MRGLCGAVLLAHLGLVASALSACGNASTSEPGSSAGSPATPAGGSGGGTGGVPTGSQSGSPSGGVAGDSKGGTPTTSGAAGNAPGGSGGAGAPGGASGSGGGSGGGGGTASVSDATLVPDASWTCGKPEGIVPPTRGKLVLSATLQLGETHDVGATPLGHRRVVDVTGGSLTGEGVTATVLTGGLELELKLSSGAMELEQLHVLRASDGTLIHLRSCGVAPAGDPVVRVVPQLEVSAGSSLAWLSDASLVGTRTVEAGAVKLALYDVTGVTASEPKLVLKDPSGEPQQTWECVTAQGTQGATVFTETVTLGGSLSVGQTKNGTRNIIPITGGTVSGRLQGKVLPGGADYQLIGGSTKLDARYTLEASDGELVVVRNCGAFGALIPIFEARAAGPYAFLNENAFLSSNPGSAAGGVSITFYERK